MDDEMNTAEVLRDEAKENRTREILELMRNSKTLEEAVEKVKAHAHPVGQLFRRREAGVDLSRGD